MISIVPPLKPDDTASVANLIQAMLALVERGVIKALDSPNRPTADELKKLANTARDELAQSQFGRATRQLVIFFQVQEGLGDNLRGVVEERTAARLNEWLLKLGLLDIPEQGEELIVRGTVNNSDGQPLAGATVHAFDRDLRKEQELGKAETDDRGQYIIRYSLEKFSLGDLPSASTPSLIVRAFMRDKQIGTDVVRSKPARDEVVDFTVPTPVLSEWERLCAGIFPLLAGQDKDDDAPLPPWELNSNDINFISEETGLDREQIRLWALSFALGRDAVTTPQLRGDILRRDFGSFVRLDPVRAAGLLDFAIIYGLFRMGLPTDPDALWSRPTSNLIAELKKSIAANYVPHDLAERLDDLEAIITQLRAAQALVPAREDRTASLGDLLGTLPQHEALSENDKLTFAHLRDEHGDTDDLWKHAEASGLSKSIPALKRTLVLDKITAGHPSLLQALQTKSDVKQPESVAFLTALELRDWIELVFEHGVPPHIGMDRDRYIQHLQVEVEDKFPTQVLGKQLEKRLNENRSFPTDRVLSFLRVNPDFDLKTQHAEPFLSENGNADDELREALLKVQRIHALTANAEVTVHLIDAGFSSAAQIVSEGKTNLALRMANKLPPERIDQVFSGAENVVATVVALGAAFGQPTFGNAVNVVPAKSISIEKLNDYPSLRTLFGDLDYCECRHCRSVLGPAAYLADLMHFLQRSPLTPNAAGDLSPANLNNVDPHLEFEAVLTGTVLGALLKRRPDLAHLELSCENTNTEIPYIDLVLEILENAVALPMVIDPSKYAGVDITAEFGKGNVPEAIVHALRETDIKVSKHLTVTENPSPAVLDNWTITDGSRRWSMLHIKPQLMLAIAGPPSLQYQQGPRVLDADGATNALTHGKLNGELEDKLSQGLPISSLQIRQVPGSNVGIQLWSIVYTRAVAIKITMASPVGVVEKFKLDGTLIKRFQWPASTIQQIVNSFAPGATTTINSNVAQLLEIPPGEFFLQIWNPARNWWELTINNVAIVAHVDERLIVSGLAYQNSSIREDLKSSPENRNPTAYNKLSSKDTVYPWTLPFDLWWEETRAFLDALGVSRTSLIDLARPQSRLSEEAAYLEFLGIPSSEADLILSAFASKEPWIYWGLAEKTNTVKDHTAGSGWTGDWQQVLVHLSMLLQQSGLSHREYLDFRQSSYAAESKGTLLPPNECQTSKILLTGLDSKQFTDHLNRIHIFTRLWRRVGWTMRDLDLALSAFGGEITPAMFKDLALLKRLSAVLALPVSALVGCIDKLETKSWTDHKKEGAPIQPSMYDGVFQRSSLRSVTDFEDFSLDKTLSTTAKISEHADFVASSLGIKPSELRSWIEGTPNLGVKDSATLENLSRLYAAASLCRALGILPETLPNVVKLFDAADAFRTLTTTQRPDEQARGRTRAMLDFVERLAFLKSSGVDLETLSYLLQHEALSGGTDPTRTVIEQQITQTLTDLRSALQTGVVLGDLSADNLTRQLARLGWYPALIEQATGSEGIGYQPGASVDISPPLTPEPAIPLNLRSKFAYRKVDTTKAVLQCTGSVSDSDFDAIQVLFPTEVPNLKNKYNTELAAHVSKLGGLLQMLELDTLPESEEVIGGMTGLPVIPGELAGRLKFEVSSSTDGKFRLRGWLSSGDLEALSEANGSSPKFSAVFSNLQAKALTKIPAPSPATLTDAELILREPDPAKRNRAILLRLVARLEMDSVAAQLSTVFEIDQQVVGRLLDAAKVNGQSAKQLFTASDFLRSDPRNPPDRTTWDAQFNALELLRKIAATAKPLDIQPKEWEWILGVTFSVMDVLALPTNGSKSAVGFDRWKQLVDLFHLRDVLPDGSAMLTRIAAALVRANDPNPALRASAFATIREEFANAFELSAGDVNAACSADLLAFDSGTSNNDYKNPSRLLALAQLLHVIKALGTTAAGVTKLIQSAPDESVAQLARKLFTAGIDTGLAERMRPISDRLRSLQRDALVTYLIARDHLEDSNELFDRYLIDVEMGSCMLTSRIKQAISSVQLFVQRCLLNLERPTTPSETGVSPTSIDTARWQWMKNYRVWEANRKVFLYPENWIEPELRDDKTEIFRAFESDLLQSEITHDTALVAIRKYLDRMVDVSNLTVVSIFDEQTDEGEGIVHLVGRDNSQPYKHYYRQWLLPPNADFGTWTAWDEISAQVDSEHLLVFVFAGSTYLAWPTISAGQVGNLNWKISMNVAKRTASGWTKLKKGRGEIQSPMVPRKDERTSLAFRIEYAPDKSILINAYGAPEQVTGEEPDPTDGPRIESDAFQEGLKQFGNISIRNPLLDLRLRALASYTYEYAGNSKKTHFRPASEISPVTIKITVTAKVDYLHFGFDADPNAHATAEHDYQISTLDYQGEFDGFIPFRTETPKPPGFGPGFITDRVVTLADVLKITVKFESSSLVYKTTLAPKTFKIKNLSSFTWHEDFIFELNEDPHWLPSGDPSLINVGSFVLRDDDSIELAPQPGQLPLFPPPPNAENYMSGHRELEGIHALAFSIYVSNTPSLNTTPGRFFVVTAQSDGTSLREIWSYRDDKFSLLFWRVWPEPKFRVVPFSTAGLRFLKSAVTKGRLLDAVALPRTITPDAVDVGTGVDFLRDPATHLDTPNSNSVTQVKIDFDKVPSSIYNWEIFFHSPLLVATQLSKAQRFEEAQRWFHLIFDPTTNEPAPLPNTGLDASSRFWRFLPFRQAGAGRSIDDLLKDLAQGKSQTPKFSLKDAINEWAENPFRPHLVARHRLRSYQFAVVQKYVENLIAWGDQLFRRDTIESINEATQLYVLAARILGKRPAASPRREIKPKSYKDIQSQLDDFSNAWIPLESLIAPQSVGGQYSSAQVTNLRERETSILYSLGSLYFCVPGNEKLSEYWDMVEDRLFKIRHCMNIEGIERQLPLFEPPIDPALLVRAIAAGLDIGAVLSEADAPLPLYRFSMMMQKALELCSEVRALGNALLSAIEKKDAEQLSLLRSGHEIQMLKLLRSIKEQQQKEAEINLEALRKTREITAQRYLNYQRLLGRKNIVVPAEGSVATLESSTLQLTPPSAGDTDTEGLALIAAESDHMSWLFLANALSAVAGSHSVLAGIFHAIPDFTAGTCVPVAAQTKFGGSNLGSATSAAGAAWSMGATQANFQAGRSATIAGHQRRYDEWQFQSNTAAKELEQIDKQIIASEIRKQIAEREIANHDRQIENAQEVDDFMREKFTNQQLYSWMAGQISGIYFRTYKLAYDMSKRVENAYRFESGLKASTFIDFGYWDNLKKGLMAGERLYHDLKRIEVAYLDHNKREYEITRHVSLMQVDPLALLRLKETGQCEVSLPEALFDLDFPGHYLRRIKSVSLTIPCVTGPYTTVPCTLTLLKHSVRHSGNASGKYVRDHENDDPRFTDSFGAVQSIVTSSAQNDSGMFETSLRDERYLPFEGAGAISSWRLELPKQFQSFDYETISDVVLHLRYTARDGGSLLKNSAGVELQTALNEFIRSAGENGLAQAFSLRHEFPTEWHRFFHPADSENKLTFKIDLKQDRFPIQFRAKEIHIGLVEIFLKLKDEKDPASTGKTYAEEYATGAGLKISLTPGGSGRLTSSPNFMHGIPQLSLSVNRAAPVTFALEATDADILAIANNLRRTVTADGTPHQRLKAEVIDDLFMVCHYSVT